MVMPISVTYKCIKYSNNLISTYTNIYYLSSTHQAIGLQTVKENDKLTNFLERKWFPHKPRNFLALVGRFASIKFSNNGFIINIYLINLDNYMLKYFFYIIGINNVYSYDLIWFFKKKKQIKSKTQKYINMLNWVREYGQKYRTWFWKFGLPMFVGPHQSHSESTLQYFFLWASLSMIKNCFRVY